MAAESAALIAVICWIFCVVSRFLGIVAVAEGSRGGLYVLDSLLVIGGQCGLLTFNMEVTFRKVKSR